MGSRVPGRVMGITAGASSPLIRSVGLVNRPPAALPLFSSQPPLRSLSSLQRLIVAGKPLRYQQTRFQTSIAEATTRLQDWAINPWRRLSLLLLTLLISFVIGVGLGTISGALDLMDLVGAVVCVAVLELSIRSRRALRQAADNRLLLHLVDMARMGLLYGLLLEGFKLL